MPLHTFLRQITDEETQLVFPDTTHCWDDFLASQLNQYTLTGFAYGPTGLRPLTNNVEMYQCSACTDPGILFAAPTEHMLVRTIERHERDTHDRDVTITDIGHYANNRVNGD